MAESGGHHATARSIRNLPKVLRKISIRPTYRYLTELVRGVPEHRGLPMRRFEEDMVQTFIAGPESLCEGVCTGGNPAAHPPPTVMRMILGALFIVYLTGVPTVSAIDPGSATAAVTGFACVTNLTASVHQISLADDSVPLSSTPSGDSTGPSLSANGQIVVFVSDAADLTSNETRASNLGGFNNVFLRNLTNAGISLISKSPANRGGNGDSWGPAVSGDGRRVVFQSRATDLVTNELNGISDVFAWDSQTESITLVSVNTSGTGSGQGESGNPLISEDGRWVVFESDASDLAGHDTNGLNDVFIRDLQSATTSLVSVNRNGDASGDGASYCPVMTPDALRIAFLSLSLDMGGPTTNNLGHVFVRDREREMTYWASVGLVARLEMLGVTNATQYRCFNPALSADGRFVAFKAAAFEQAKMACIFRFELETAETVLISTNAAPNISRRTESSGPTLSADGQTLAYEGADNFIHVWRSQGATEWILPTQASGSALSIGRARAPLLSGDGRTLSYVSDFPKIVPGVTNLMYEVYRTDLQTGQTRLASADGSGNPLSESDMGTPVMSDDGTKILFQTRQALLAVDANDAYDVYLRDFMSDAIALVSGRSEVTPNHANRGASFLGDGAISADGRWLTFTTVADGLVAGDTNGFWDVIVRDLYTGANMLASANTNGSAANGHSRSPSLSADGRKIAFVSSASDLVPNDENQVEDVFVRDLTTDLTTLVSVNSSGARAATLSSGLPIISPDGRWVAFRSKATDLAANPVSGENLYLRDLRTRSTRLAAVLASSPASHIAPLVFSPDGTVIYFGEILAEMAAGADHGQPSMYFFAVAPECGPDTDKDGMDDEWELAHFGDLSHHGSEDTDGDGLTDLQEFWAGTDPTKADSVLAVRLAGRDANGGVQLRWPALPGRTYRIEYKAELTDSAWIPLPQGIVAESLAGSYAADPNEASRRFYRVFLNP